ncbi:tRNA methylation protein TRM732 Ecym_2688 [Eremothecium cymbalariae DBVPG|uniref:Uncharacterized protein n=1 Tax=Eremothecium cymbalariae (strain CBS 270.75 / DBVPG 7215 / KCTC 17166 / NRRL Y-17582) TaxID=931890 RepID=G8JPD0_ERECY|nr:Hypothetical protein Ecym_2688 [Eremothecium cymbalariae DBVPG\
MMAADINYWKSWLINYKTDQFELDYDGAILGFERSFMAIFESLQEDHVSDETRLVLTDAVGIWMLRSRQLLTKSNGRGGYEVVLKEQLLTLERATFLFRYVIDFWSGGGAPLANSLRHMFSKMLQLLEEIHKDEVLSVYKLWIEDVLSISPFIRFLYFLLDAFAAKMDLKMVLELRPGFIESSLSYMWSDSLSSLVGKCITTLLINLYTYHYSEHTLVEWLELWEAPVIKFLNQSRCAKRVRIYVLANVFKSVPPLAFNLFIWRNLQQKPGLLLPLLKIGQELAIEEEPFHENKLISLNELSSLLTIDQYKLAAFEVLTYSPKGSRPVRPYIFDIIKKNLQIFFVDFDIETRNSFHSSFRHFINRIRDSTYSLNRDALKLRAKNKFPDEQEDKLKQVGEARQFLQYLVEFMTLQIAPGMQYQRKSLAYKFLNTLALSGVDSVVDEKFLDTKKRMEFPFRISIFDGCMIRLLCDNMTNDYDDIRQWSLELLLTVFNSPKGKPFHYLVDTVDLERKAYQLLNFYKDSDGGSKVMEFLFSISTDQIGFMTKLINELDTYLSATESDLTQSLENPVSGLFTTLNVLFVRYEFTNEAEYLIQSCINLVLKNWNTAKEILCHDSPEGNLPLKYLNGGTSDAIITSYAFKSIKESSSLFSTLLLRAPMSNQQLIECGELLIDQLSTIRHSGAFQSIIPSFASCCKRCMRDIPNQMEAWLNESIKSLQTKTQYITRRSGGLPFLITAILAAEKNKSRPWLKYTYESLSEIARIPILEHEEKLDLPQVNALNCIRTLFIESTLSEACTPYVYPALELCLENFTSPLWAMRNCSIMLFTALQNRLFGKIGKNTSARLFFTRYKGIREILLKKLQESVDITSRPSTSRSITSTVNSLIVQSEQSEIESIFLVLTTLSRLKPTPGYDGLDAFKLEILKCLENRNWKIREMAARALPALIEEPYQQSLSLLDNRKCSVRHQNRLHGRLLAVKQLVTLELSKVDARPIPLKLSNFILRSYNYYIGKKNPCNVTAKAYVDVVRIILENSIDVLESDKLNLVRHFGNYFAEANERYIVDGSLQLLLAEVVKVILQNEKREHITDIVLLGIYSPFFEVQLATLEYIQSSINIASASFAEVQNKLMEMVDARDVYPHVKSVVLKTLEKSRRVMDSNRLFAILDSNLPESMQASALALLGSCAKSHTDDEKLWSLTKKYSQDEMPHHFRMSSLCCLINRLTSSNIIVDNNCFKTKLLYAIYCSLWDDDVDIRTTAAIFLNKNYLELTHVQQQTSASVTAELFTRKFAETAEPGVILDLCVEAVSNLENNLSSVQPQEASVFRGLFAIEDDNQFRNTISFATNYIFLLGSIKPRTTEVEDLIKFLESRLLNHVDCFSCSDGFLGWCSDPDIFNFIIILRNLIAQLSSTHLELIDNRLIAMKCHPSVFRMLG